MKKIILICVVVALIVCFTVSCDLKKDLEESLFKPSEMNTETSESTTESSEQTEETTVPTESTETTTADLSDDWTGYY